LREIKELPEWTMYKSRSNRWRYQANVWK